MHNGKLIIFHALNDIGMEKAGNIASAFDKLLSALEQLCPEGRELSTVRTKLEEAGFFATKAMASSPENGAQG
jgi:hypothetical protein